MRCTFRANWSATGSRILIYKVRFQTPFPVTQLSAEKVEGCIRDIAVAGSVFLRGMGGHTMNELPGEDIPLLIQEGWMRGQ
jgi:hypothetical protein